MTLSVETTPNLFEIYERRREELISIARRQHEVLVTLGIDDTQAEGSRPAALVEELIKRLQTERLRVLVIGCFSAGKSTFINALLGSTILPASPAPTTGVLCEIRYADEAHKKATLFPKPGMGPNGGSEPFDVTILDLHKELGQYVKIDYRNAEATSKYQKLELLWPLPLCEHGVDLIDSVGLDDPDSRDRITMDETRAADAIVYCMTSAKAYSAKDQQVISFLQSLGYRSIFFVLTFWDLIRASAAIGETTEEKFAAEQRHNLAPWTELGENGIKFVDSKSAVFGRIAGDREKVATSGIEDVESSLQRFLTEEKARAKLLTALRALRSANRAARTAIPTRVSLWQTSATELARRYKEAEVPLQSLQTQRQLLVAKVDVALKDISREARDLASRHFLELPDHVKTCAETYKIETDIPFRTTKENLQPVVEEVTRYLKQQVEEDIARWVQNDLSPLVNTRVQQLQESLEEHARNFVEKIDQLRVQITLGAGTGRVEQREGSTWVRVLAVGAYIGLTGNFLIGGMGAMLGPRAMMTTVGIQAASNLALMALGLFNPLTFVATTVAAIVATGFLNRASMKRGIKERVAGSVAAELITRRDEMAANIECRVFERLTEVRNAIDAGLRNEIASVRGEVESVMAAQQRGQADADTEINKLQAIEKNNLAVEEEIEALMYEAGIGG